MDAAAREIAPPDPVYADGEAVAAAPLTTRAPWSLPRPVSELG